MPPLETSLLACFMIFFHLIYVNYVSEQQQRLDVSNLTSWVIAIFILFLLKKC